MVHQLIAGQEEEVAKHDLGDGAQSSQRQARGQTNNRGFGDRCRQDPIRIGRRQPLRHLERATVGIEDVFSEDDKAKQEGNPKSPLAQRGFLHVPAPGAPGGVVARGPIERDITVNLVALRRLTGIDPVNLRRYILGLALVAAAEPLDGFLRQGCLLTLDPGMPADWAVVGRDGKRQSIDLTAAIALNYATRAAATFGVGQDRKVIFRKDFALGDLKDSQKKKAGAKAKAAD